jgi:hypothetical protein
VFDVTVSRAVSIADIAHTLPRLASKTLLLAGQTEELGISCMRWQAPVQMPWGRSRFLIIGDVSRETRFT